MIKPSIPGNPEYACVSCNAAGWIPPDGEPLSEHEALLFLREQLRRARLRIQVLQRHDPGRREQGPDYYGTPGYKGD